MSLKTVLQNTFLKSRFSTGDQKSKPRGVGTWLMQTIVETFAPSGQLRHLAPKDSKHQSASETSIFLRLLGLTFFGIAPENFTEKNNWTNMSVGKKIVSAIYAVLLPLRIVAAVLTNILRIGTEIIPKFFSDLIGYGIEGCTSRIKNTKGTAYFWESFRVGLIILRVPFLLWSWVGRAFTSPVVSARAAYATGRELAGNGTAGKALGLVLAAVSIAITAMTWIALAPLATKLIVSKIIMHIPLLSTVGAWFAKTTVGTWLAKTFGLGASSHIISNSARIITNGAAMGVTVGGSYGLVGTKLPVDAARNAKSRDLVYRNIHDDEENNDHKHATEAAIVSKRTQYVPELQANNSKLDALFLYRPRM